MRADIVASNLRIDAATAEVMRGFEADRVASLLLKGPSFSRWLYAADAPRSYADSDLLIRPDDIETAEKVLIRLGFAKLFDEQRMPTWWREHASEWWRGSDGVLVDLHRTLPGVGVDADSAWRALSASRDTITLAGQRTPTLALPARALHVALHAAHHGAEWGQPVDDLNRALAIADRRIWIEAAALARQLAADEAFSVGLRLTAAGQAIADDLGLSASRSVAAALRASSPPPIALGFEQLAGAGGTLRRVRIVWRKLVPPAEFIRRWSPQAAKSRPQLVLAYVRRPFWVLRNAPRGLRAWLRARREVRSRQS